LHQRDHPEKLLRAHVGNREPRPRDVLRGGAPRAGLSRGKPPAGRDPADSRPSSGGLTLRPLLVRVAHVLGLPSPWPLHRDPSGPCSHHRGVRLGRSRPTVQQQPKGVLTFPGPRLVLVETTPSWREVPRRRWPRSPPGTRRPAPRRSRPGPSPPRTR